MKRKYLLIIALFFFGILAFAGVVWATSRPQTWSVQSVDTMKYSRDMAQKSSDPGFDREIDSQMGQIAQVGATHVAIGTPYDEQFIPVLQRWVKAARKHHLKIWFRGNFAGWEGWFGYPRIGQKEHLELTRQFLTQHQELFENGDIFSACPECENGGPGDPRKVGDVEGYRNFLVSEYVMTRQIFWDQRKVVASNYYSMNADVARLIMDRETTRRLDGIVVIDHYVKTPGELAQDVRDLAKQSGGQIVLGEFGAPIPDINGKMTEKQQTAWLTQTLNLLAKERHLIGVNYWVNKSGSTALWRDGGAEKMGVKVLRNYYLPTRMRALLRFI